jgi:hypothetical protein
MAATVTTLAASMPTRTSFPLGPGEQQLIAAPALCCRLVLGVRILSNFELPDELIERHLVEVAMDLDRHHQLLQMPRHDA